MPWTQKHLCLGQLVSFFIFAFPHGTDFGIYIFFSDVIFQCSCVSILDGFIIFAFQGFIISYAYFEETNKGQHIGTTSILVMWILLSGEFVQNRSFCTSNSIIQLYRSNNLPSFKSSNFPAPHANIVTSICRFVSFIISIAFSVETAAAFKNCPAMPPRVAPRAMHLAMSSPSLRPPLAKIVISGTASLDIQN